MTTPPVVLTVAGTDSGGAAGIAADLATIGHLGCHGACVVTAVTAQDTTGVHAVHPVPIEIVDAQLGAVLDDLPVAVVKTGMLGTPAVVRARRRAARPPAARRRPGPRRDQWSRARRCRRWSTPTSPTAAASPLVATPNLDEARALTGRDGPPADLAARLADLGCAVVLTGRDGRRRDLHRLALPPRRSRRSR